MFEYFKYSRYWQIIPYFLASFGGLILLDIDLNPISCEKFRLESSWFRWFQILDRTMYPEMKCIGFRNPIIIKSHKINTKSYKKIEMICWKYDSFVTSSLYWIVVNFITDSEHQPRPKSHNFLLYFSILYLIFGLRFSPKKKLLSFLCCL